MSEHSLNGGKGANSNLKPASFILPENIPQELFSALAPELSEQAGPGNGPFQAVSLAGIRKLADFFAVSRIEAMRGCLLRGIWPLRFARNRGFLSAREQALLLQKHVLIVGCGGLGGHASELLVRMGLGCLTLCDGDVFEESNLNRQAFCREDTLGKSKAEAVKAALELTASHAMLRAYPFAVSPETLPDLFGGVDIVLDCLDNLHTRFQVEEAAHRAGVTFIHGAIAGAEGFVLVSRPGQAGVKQLYEGADVSGESGAEKIVGVPTVTPATVASLQASLAVAELLGKGSSEGSLLHLDVSAPALEMLSLL